MSLPLNLTAHAVGYDIGYDLGGRWQIGVVVKATFRWKRDGSVVAVDPLPILDRDELAGNLGGGGPLRPADIGQPKPNIDVLLAGALVFPVAIDRIVVKLQIGSSVDKKVLVFGDRVWVPGVMADAVPSSPKPTQRVPIHWERSFGGIDPMDPKQTDPRNPVGTGVAARPQDLHGKPAPNFEDPAREIASSKTRPTPVGFGPIAAHWSQRVALAGTYDDKWRQNRFPLPPTDLDPRFFNVAPEDQQLSAYLPGESVRLSYMTMNGHDRFALPEFSTPVTIVSTEDFIDEIATVDTVVIEPEEQRFSLIARATAPLRPGPEAIRHVVVGNLTRGLRTALERGKGHPLLRSGGSPARGQS